MLEKSETKQLVPMTWDQFVTLSLKWFSDEANEEDVVDFANCTQDERDELLDIVRMIESFHGISKQTKSMLTAELEYEIPT